MRLSSFRSESRRLSAPYTAANLSAGKYNLAFRVPPAEALSQRTSALLPVSAASESAFPFLLLFQPVPPTRRGHNNRLFCARIFPLPPRFPEH